jgi:hypothetical protein
MIWDVNLFGVYVNAGLATAVLAALFTLALRKLFALAGGYPRVWHPALFDISLFVLAWAGLAAASARADRLLLILFG